MPRQGAGLDHLSAKARRRLEQHYMVGFAQMISRAHAGYAATNDRNPFCGRTAMFKQHT